MINPALKNPNQNIMTDQSREVLLVDLEKGLIKDSIENEIDKSISNSGSMGGPLTIREVQERRAKYGLNALASEKKNPCYMVLLQAFFHPFNILLCIIATLSAVTSEYTTTTIIFVMVLISTALRFYQEWKSEGAVHGLLKLITKSVSVIRFDAVEPTPREMTVPCEDLVPGDWVVLRPGELVPADGIIISSKVFYVSQAPLTGEAIPVEKYQLDDDVQETEEEVEERRLRHQEKRRRVSLHVPMSNIKRFFRTVFGLKITTEAQLDHGGFQMREDLSCTDHVFMGTQVITGMATVRILRTGPRTLFGRMAEALTKTQPTSPFQQGVKRISWIFFLTMSIMVPPVFFIQFFYKNDNLNNWKPAFIFSLSVAVGLTPEMLPMIVNATLAKGSIEMSKKSSIIKKLDAIINLGAVDVLCTDKTGTLTKSVVTLSLHLNPFGAKCYFALQIGYLNSYFQSVLQNPLDTAITTYYDKLATPDSVEGEIPSEKPSYELLEPDKFVHQFSRVDELPFDFVRRRLSVILKENNTAKEKVYLVCKGAVEEVLSVCSRVMKENAKAQGTEDIFPRDSDLMQLTEKLAAQFIDESIRCTELGQRVLAVAYKPLPKIPSGATTDDEIDLIFVGFLTFTDPPKETARQAIVDMIRHNIEIKVLTGDSPNICASVCAELNLPVKKIITGEELRAAEKTGSVWEVVQRGTIFAKLTPLQKLLVVKTLKSNQHVVGFMGDGINDAPALKESDVGISVENGVDICREAADVILLDKDLSVVVEGIRIGRKTYGNTIKYIAMAVSSNFGNVFSVLVASVWLPYEPMTSLHLLTQNLLYDCSQIGIPWDNMDEEFLMVPHKWKIRNILRFMIWMGPWSSVFDITTFCFMYFYYEIKTNIPNDPVNQKQIRFFQTSWFTVGLLTQTLIVHMIRTTKIPIIQSRASLTMTLLTIAVMGIGLALPYIPKIKDGLDFSELPAEFYYFLLGILLAYCVAANIAKFIYIAIFKQWF